MANDEKESQVGKGNEQRASDPDAKTVSLGAGAADVNGARPEPEAKAPEKAEPKKAAERAASSEEDEEEGWPRSWVVTTVILGIIAIVIVARLVGQSWKREEPFSPKGEPKGMPGKMEPGKMEPGKMEPGKMEPGKMEPGKMEPGKMEPGKMEPGKMEPGKAQPARSTTGPFASKLSLKDVSIPKGMFCIGSDGTPTPKATQNTGKCSVVCGNVAALRVHLQRSDPKARLKVQVTPALDAFELMTLDLPASSDKDIYFGSTNWYQSDLKVALMVENTQSAAVKLEKVEVLAGGSVKSLGGKEASRVVLDGASASGNVKSCIGTDKKAYPLKADAEPPAACVLSTKNASYFRLEFERSTEGPVRIAVMPAAKAALPLFSSIFLPEPVMGREYIEGSLLSAPAVMIVVSGDVANAKVTFKTLSFATQS
jgi:hypothetical protein